ncbi:MAG TPA: hypothetical protein VE977_13815 [Pyrinomonadaceae bacterium]|nr:hypothetical protein [Pyrinomonadaceae bacterium]
MNTQQLRDHLMKWACIQRVVRETGKSVFVVLSDFNRLMKVSDQRKAA